MWVLSGDNIADPKTKTVTRDIQQVNHRKLNGGITRDFIGAEKMVIAASYQNIRTSDLDIILGHYEDQRDNGTPKTLAIADIGFSGSVNIELGSEVYSIEQCYYLRQIDIIFREV